MAHTTESNRQLETSHLTADQHDALPHNTHVALSQVDNLKYFLISAPVEWANDQYIRRFMLPTGEYVSCVLWANLFHITGTDIVRCLAFRFHAFGRPVKNSKKFEEGIFSDLRNLKAGNDASLEEPKSPFLDFLYKNNCIRTQKKQKVFYWFSVPHDRLFLDALERDLKREKSGQEITTESRTEPSLSFVYDTSRSLYEQLTHGDSQQSLSNTAHSRSASVAPDTSSFLPHDQYEQHSQTVSSTNGYVSSSALNDTMTSSQSFPAVQTQMMMPTSTEMMKNDHSFDSSYSTAQFSYGQQASYQQPGQLPSMPRYGSVPTHYIEASPAPSFASTQSYYGDQSRAVSYEPVTPPQYGYHYNNTDLNVSHDSGYYGSACYDQQNSYQSVSQYSTIMPPPPPPRFSSVPRQMPTSAQYAHIEGSPLYKQRKRGHSLTGTYGQHYSQVPQTQAALQQSSPYAVRRPSDLRRAVSASVVPQSYVQERAASQPPPGSQAYLNMLRQSQTPDRSRQGSPMASVETQQPMHLMHDRYAGLMHDGSHVQSHSRHSSPGPGVIRRARSVTVDTEPYPTKNHSCPIDGCGRIFKRLEHLKRHVRTHTQEKPYGCPHCDKAFSRSDNLAQHRRTHEFGGSFTEEEPESQESDSCAGLTEDVDSPESVANNSTLPPIDTFDQLVNYAAYDEKTTSYKQHADDFYAQDSMGLPVTVAHDYAY